MSSKSLALVAVASLCFAGCTVQPRAAAPAPAAPVAAAPAPVPTPAPAKAAPAPKGDVKKNAREKASAGSATADATKYWSYEDIKRALKKDDGTGDMVRGKIVLLNGKKTKAGSFYVNSRDEIYFTCRTGAANVKSGMFTGTVRGVEFWDGPVLTDVRLDNCAPA